MNHYDILVIGGGPGGMGAALRAAELGAQDGARRTRRAGRRLPQLGVYLPPRHCSKARRSTTIAARPMLSAWTLGGEAKPDMARIVARVARRLGDDAQGRRIPAGEEQGRCVARRRARLAGEGRVIVGRRNGFRARPYHSGDGGAAARNALHADRPRACPLVARRVGARRIARIDGRRRIGCHRRRVRIVLRCGSACG